MSKGSRRRKGTGYEDNYEKIFGRNKAVTSFKLFSSRSRESSSGVHIIDDIEPFRSPVTGEIITTRSQLKEHNKLHGVTDSRDYSREFFDRKAQERDRKMRGMTKRDRRNRIELLKRELNY